MKKYVILCETRKESDLLLNLFEELGFVRGGGPKPTEGKFMRELYKSATAYRIAGKKERKISISRVGYYEANGYLIIPFKEGFELIKKKYFM